MIKFWNELSRAAKFGLGAGVTVIVALTIVAAVWVFRTDYQVLFADLKPQDSAVMVAELDRLKIPYKIAESGTTILVEKEVVHSTRLKLLGKELPLHGVVGLELFNNSDFGMTEFAQKINYQRALQGEITRTISSLAEISDVRVHLALPEEGLFKKSSNKAKAAITIALKPGQTLRTEQILGIQRLVAASVPGILAQDVTIVDKQGVALTRAAGQSDSDFVATSLELKRDTENLLSKKVNEVLARTFGEGAASATVDVVLNMDQIKVTTEDVLSAPNESGHAAGVIVKDKESIRDLAAPLESGATGQATKSGASTREVEYQVGRRVEQIVSQPGAIKRLSAVAVIQKALTDEQKVQVQALVVAAVGAIEARGDQVVVQGLLAVDEKSESNEVIIAQPTPSMATPSVRTDHVASASVVEGSARDQVIYVLLAVLVLIFVLLFVFMFQRSSRSKALSETERVLALRNIQGWISGAESDFSASVDSRLQG